MELELPLRRTGRTGARPLVLLHGYSDSAQSFDLLTPLLHDDFDLLAVDQRGHGDAPHPDDGCTVAELAADVVAVLDRAGLGRATLVGHSMGSLVARAVAAHHPERVDALVLLGPLPATPNDAMAWLRAEVHGFGDEPPVEWVRDFQTSTSGPAVPDDFLESVVAASLRMPGRVWRAVADALATTDDSAELAAIHAPTLLLWGERDEVSTLDEQQALATAIPVATLRVLPGVGHAPHWEAPAVVAEAVRAFLDGA